MKERDKEERMKRGNSEGGRKGGGGEEGVVVLQSYSRSDIADSWEEVICRKQMWSQRESWPLIQHITQHMWSMLLPENVGMCRKLEWQLEHCNI